MFKKLFIVSLAALGLAGCMDDAQVATNNIIKDADNFKIPRRVVFYNGITDSYILTVEGYCSFDTNPSNTAVSVICKDNDGFKRHTLVLSDNTTAFVEQLSPRKVSTNFYKVTFKPTTIIPDVEWNSN